MTEHLPQERLLRYVDGELPRKARKLAARHLESCWHCRVELEKLQNDIHLIVEAHGSFLHAIPPPPRSWGGLDAQLRAPSGRKRGLPRVRPMLRPMYAGGVLAVAICFVIWILPESMTAEQVLHKVTDNDGERMHSAAANLIRQRVRVTRTETWPTRKTAGMMECWSLANRSYWRIAATDGPGQRFRARAADVRVAGQLPLAPEAYQTWLQRTGAAPVLERDSASRMTLVASTAEHARDQLWQVRLFVNTAAWQVSGMELVYAQEKFEITEEQFTVIARKDAPRDVLASLGVAPSLVAPPIYTSAEKHATAPVSAQELDAVELGALVRLHRLKADLGEPLQVARNGGKVVVEVSEESPERQRELARALANRPGVVLRTSRGPAGIPAPVVDITLPDESSRSAVRMPGNEEELRAFFGGFQEQENFTAAVLERERALEGHLYALRNLARRFDPTHESQLSPVARQDLDFLVTDHENAARQELGRLQVLVQPLIQHFVSAPEPAHGTGKTAHWQENAARALAAAQAANLALRRVLTTTNTPASPADALPAVRQYLQDVQTVL